MMQQDFSKKFSIVLKKGLESWQLTNTLGHIAAFLGSKVSENFDTGELFVTADKKVLPRNSQYPIITLSASGNKIKTLIDQARERKLVHIGFIQEMIDYGDDSELEEAIAKKSEKDLDYLGVGIFGPREELDSLTKNVSLWR